MNQIQSFGHKKIQILSLLIISLFPFSFTKLGPIDHFGWIEALAPIAFIILFSYIILNKLSFFPTGSGIVISAMLLLGLLAAIHFISEPQFPNAVNGGYVKSGFRRYYEIVIGLCLFFYFLWFSYYNYEGNSFWKSIITIIMLLSLVVGYIRLITYVLGMEMPLLGGNFLVMYDTSGEGAYRIGGLTDVATLGISALIAIYYQKQWNFKFFVFLSQFLFLLIMSGGRTASFAVIITLMAYVFFIEKREKGKKLFLMFILLISVVLAILTQMDLISHQFERLTAVEGGFATNSPSRLQLYKEEWKIFLNRPIIGKGIGPDNIPWNASPFIKDNLFDGGHGSYLSIIMLFGLGGAFYLFIAMFGSIMKGYIFLENNRFVEFVKDDCILVCFCLVFLCMLSILFIAEGSGYNRRSLFVLAGIIAGKFSASKTRVVNATEDLPLHL